MRASVCRQPHTASQLLQLTTMSDLGQGTPASRSASCRYGRSLSALDMGAAPLVLVSTHTSVLSTGRGHPGGNMSGGCLPSCTAAELTFCLPRRSCPVPSMLISSKYCRLPVNATRAGTPHVPQVQPGSSVRGQAERVAARCSVSKTHNKQLHSAGAGQSAASPACAMSDASLHKQHSLQRPGVCCLRPGPLLQC